MCEHSNYRGRQFLLEPIEITNWPKFSQLLTIGSMYPVRQVRIIMTSFTLFGLVYNTVLLPNSCLLFLLLIFIFTHILFTCAHFHFLQRRHFFRIKSKERGHFLSIQGGIEKMKSGRVVVIEQVEGMSDIWFYQEGLIKNKVLLTRNKVPELFFISFDHFLSPLLEEPLELPRATPWVPGLQF